MVSSKRIYKKIIVGVIITLILAFAVGIYSYASKGEEITSRQQLNNPDITIGTGDGSAAVNVIKKELPDANIAYLEAVQGYQTVAQGKIDAYIFERLPMEKAMDHGLEGVRILDENMEEQLNIAVGISPNCKIPDFENELNSFIKSIKEDGTLDDMYNR